MSNNIQTNTTSALHNAIMEAGGKDRPPMLAPDNYVQWKSQIRRYIDTKPNRELIHYCIDNGPYQYKETIIPATPGTDDAPPTRESGVKETYATISKEIRKKIDAEAEAVHIILTRTDNDIYSIVDACPNATKMWKEIERLKQGENINKHDVETNLYRKFRKFTSKDGESLESYYSRMAKDPNSSLGKTCLGKNVVEISSDKVGRIWNGNSPEFKTPLNMETNEGTEAMDKSWIKENMSTNEYACKIMLEHEFKKGNKVVNKELIVALRAEIYFVKFIINPEEDDVEPGVILGISFLRMTKAITDFRAGTVTIYPEIDPFLEDIEEEEKNKVELDGKIVKEEEEAVKRIKGEALKEKDDPGAFIFPIRLEGHVNENALADTGSDINTMPYRIYKQLGREEMKKVDRGITMINHTQAEAMGLTHKWFLSVVVGRGFLRTIGGIVNTPERLFSTFDGFCHQTFRAARSDVMRNAESDSDDEEEYQIKRNKFRAPIYGPKPAPLWERHEMKAGSIKSKRSRQHETDRRGIATNKFITMILAMEGCQQRCKVKGAYNPPGYAQPQYDQYYQQYPPPSPKYQQQQQNDDE
ncbi:hypothetical protein Tco_0580771 [Tanacetum coccineum]